GRLINVRGERSYLPIVDGSSRYLRLRLSGGTPTSGKYAVRSVSVQPLEFAATPTALLASMAKDAPRREFPRAMHNEQVYWSVIGVSGGQSEALLSEDGQLELAKRGPSLEPFLSIGGKLVAWADVMPTQSLLDSVRPIPSVTWRTDSATLTVTAFAAGTVRNSSTYARYRITNRARTRLTGNFWLALRPLQVNPPWQFLNTPGGAAKVDSLSWNGTVLRANAALRITPLTQPVRVGVTTLDGGEASTWIRDNQLPPDRRVVDHRALASAVMLWPYDIAPGDSTDFVVASVLDGSGDPQRTPAGSPSQVREDTEARVRQVADTWARDQDAVTIHLPKAAPPLVAAIKANLAWILINRDGAGIQPGSRSYERSWIRDGALTAEALLRLGRSAEAKQFAEWYAPFQYPSGKVPCCVDYRGADPVDEHDSHGQLIHLIHEVWRYTGDGKFARKMWPHVKRSVQFLDSLRSTHLTKAYDHDTLRTRALRPGDKDSLSMFRGLLPASISHEGYSAKPMHSIWDDGFALLGYREAVDLAEALGERKSAAAFRKSLEEFDRDFHQALYGVMTRNNIPFIPGSIELADFDATSTTTLLSPGDGTGMPGEPLRTTFERYYASSRNRARPDSLWENYTPYEWRTVGAMLRLGMRDEAIDMIDQFMRDRRPANWHQWAEVVWREPRNPKFIGDMPHTWVGSDFIRSALDLFAYREPCTLPRVAGSVGQTYTPMPCVINIGKAIPAAWLENGDSIVVRGLRTGGVTIGYSMKKVNNTYVIEFDDTLRPSDLVVFPPMGVGTSRTEADGQVLPYHMIGEPVLVPGTTRRLVFFISR
ncbi:MAG: coagulation factor 5/8 type domain-containing protein, partial [Phycisphaerae bacterium]|nr:coagulation factor 5/8 type domain-containing protein [Gemmatimonadaceae bacterium]